MSALERAVAPPTTPESSPAAPGGSQALDPRRWLALAVIATAQLMVVVDGSIVNIALPSAQRSLGISDADRQWVVTAYTLTFGGLLLLGGRIADHVGRKRVFVIGLVGFALASALGAAAGGAATLFGARALQGAFAALLAPAALSLISVTFTTARERVRAFGVYGAVSGGGAAIGMVLGGLLTEYATWRWCLLVNSPIALGAALLALPLVRESRAPGHPRYDVLGAVLVTGGLTAVVYGFTQAGVASVGWAAPTTTAALLVGVVLLVAFLVAQARSSHPLLPLRVLTERNRAGALVASLLMAASLFAMFLFLAFYFQQELGYAPLRSGTAFLPFSAGIIASATAAPVLLPRTGAKPLLLAGALLGAAGLAWLTRLGAHSSYLVHVLPAELAISAGMGLASVAWSALGLHGVEDRDVGVASALLNTTQQFGGSLGTALLNTVYAGAATALAGYHRAFTAGALLLLVALTAVAVLVNAGRSTLAGSPGAPVTPPWRP